MKTISRPSSVTFLIKIGLLIFSGIAFSFCQANKSNDNWWKPLVKKHSIKYESFTVHNQFVIFGNKTVTNDIESFINVTAISNEKNNYTIYNSKEASYNNKTTVLKIYDCTMKVYDWNSNNTEPSNIYNHISYTVNFSKGFSNMADTLVR